MAYNVNVLKAPDTIEANFYPQMGNQSYKHPWFQLNVSLIERSSKLNNIYSQNIHSLP